ncbi:MAG: hypothetical protein AB7W37_13065 [Syntrophobacteraceae bacterium]
MEFGKPIMEAIKSEYELEEISEVIQGIWNYAITLGADDEGGRDRERNEVPESLERLLDIDRAGA